MTVYNKQTIHMHTHIHIRGCTPTWVVLISHNKQSICTDHRLPIYQKQLLQFSVLGKIVFIIKFAKQYQHF